MLKRIIIFISVFILGIQVFAEPKIDIVKQKHGRFTFYKSVWNGTSEAEALNGRKSTDGIKSIRAFPHTLESTDGSNNVLIIGEIDHDIITDISNIILKVNILAQENPLGPAVFDVVVYSKTAPLAELANNLYPWDFVIITHGESNQKNYTNTENAFLNGYYIVEIELIDIISNESVGFKSTTLDFKKTYIGISGGEEDFSMLGTSTAVFYILPSFYKLGEDKISHLLRYAPYIYPEETEFEGFLNAEGIPFISKTLQSSPEGLEGFSPGSCVIAFVSYDGKLDSDGKTYYRTKYGKFSDVFFMSEKACWHETEIKKADNRKEVIEAIPGTNAYKTKAHRLELIDTLGRILKSVEGPGKPLTIEEAGAYYLRAREKNGRVAGSKGVVKTR